MIILCCGDRNWCDPVTIKKVLIEYQPHLHNSVNIIHGNADGADTLSALAAISLKYGVESYPANWSRYGRAAGPIRNQQMLDKGKPDLVIVFHSDIENSKGTADMVRRAKKANIPVRIVT